MICQQCGSRPATRSFTKIVNGKELEIHICDYCAENRENSSIQGISSDVLNEDVLSDILEDGANDEFTNELSTEKTQPARDIQCPNCGLTYSEFVKTGRVGCVECYIQFADPLTTMLLRNHGTVSHNGKVPKRKSEVINDKQQLETLKKELQSLIEREEYEQAADIRDQIRELEEKLSSQ